MAVAFSPTGSHLVSGGDDKSFRLWDARTGRLIGQSSPVAHRIDSIEFLPDGAAYVAVAGKSTIRWTVAAEPLPNWVFTDDSRTVAIAPDGRSAITGQMKISVVDLTTGKLIRELPSVGDEYWALAISPNSSQALSAGNQGIVRLWDLKTGEELRQFVGHKGRVQTAAFLEKSGQIVSGGSDDGTIRIWDANTGSELCCINTSGVIDLAVLRGRGQLASGHLDGWVRLFDVETGDELAVGRGHTDRIWSVAISPDQSRLASASRDGSVRLWSVTKPTRPGLDVASASEPDHGLDSESAPNGTQIAVAVMGFEEKGTSVEFNRLGAAIAEMLAHDLERFPEIRVLERTASGEMIQERTLAELKIVGNEGAALDKLAAEYLITGTSTASAGKLAITAHLTKSGETKPFATWEHAGGVAELLTIEAAILKQVTQALQVSGVPRRISAAPPSDDSPTLAILSLTNHGPKAGLETMEEGFADMLQASLGAIEGVKLVDRNQIASILAEQKLSLSGLVDPQTAVQVGQLLRAERLLVGSFLELGPNFNVHVRLIDSESGSIVASERISGSREDFAAMLEKLTLQILNDLSRAPSDNAMTQIQSALPARSMESAVHFAAATRLVSQGRHPQAAEAYQKVLLLEPGNILCYLRLMNAYWQQGKMAELEQTAHRAMGRAEFGTAPPRLRSEILWLLAYDHFYLNRYPELVRVTDQILAEFPDSKHGINQLRGGMLLKLNRYEEGIQLMESAAGGDPDPATDWKNPGLQALFNFYAYRIMDGRTPKSVRTTEKTRESCRRAMEIFDRILVSAAGKRDRDARTWASMLVPGVTAYLMYVDEQGYNQLYLSPAERADAMRRALEVFDWDPFIRAEGSFSRGAGAELAGDLDQAWAAYQTYLQTCPALEQVFGGHQGMVPSNYDSRGLQPTTWIDKKIEAYYRLAKISRQRQDSSAEVTQAYQDMVREVGLSNFRGPDAVAEMADLDIQPEYPEKCALVWGWETTGQRSWERVLSPVGYKVHSLRTSHVTPAKLAPYSLIVLIRSGSFIFTPTEILALRSYVASGGALLTIVTPGWEPAAPLVHRGLLQFFDIEVKAALPTRTSATRFAEHPITAGITAVDAKCAVALRGPRESIMISAGDDALMIAGEYRLGRVVVASFGQWLLPEPSVFVTGWQNYRSGGVTAQQPASDLPFEAGPGLARPLLDNVIRWLGERPERGPEFKRWKESLSQAHWSAFRVHARNLDWNEMTNPHERLIAAAPDRLLREESLWTAGEAYFQYRCHSENKHLMEASYGFEHDTFCDADPAPYQRLIEEFSASPLVHFSEWRLAECYARNSMLHVVSRLEPKHFAQANAAYDKVSAEPGTYPWAWARLKQAGLAIRPENYSLAVKPLLEVAELMPHGTERMLALTLAADCLFKTGRTAEAKRYYEELKLMPVMTWSTVSDQMADWRPIKSTQDSSHRVAFEGQTRLGKP